MIRCNQYEVLAIDLSNTLVHELGDTCFIAMVNVLANHGIDQSHSDFKKLFRRRYIEYSLGNYSNDYEFYESFLNQSPDTNIYDITDELNILINEYSIPFDESAEFLRMASKKHRLVLSSNFVNGWAKRILETNNWGSYFESLCISSEVRFRKPSRHYFTHLIRLAKCKRERLLFIGDSIENDIVGSRISGINSVRVDRNKECVDEDSTNKVINNLLDLFYAPNCILDY